MLYTYLYDTVDGLSVQKIHFDGVLWDFPGMPEQSTFEYEAILATGQSRVAGPSAQRREATGLSGLFDLLFSANDPTYVYRIIVCKRKQFSHAWPK